MQNVHYFLRYSIRKIVIKGSFTDNFYPSQVFSSDEMENFTRSVMFFFSIEKINNKSLQNVFFLMKVFHMERVVQLQ